MKTLYNFILLAKVFQCFKGILSKEPHKEVVFNT